MALEAIGLRFDAINKSNKKRKRSEPLHALGKKPAQDKKSPATTLKAIRYGISQRRKDAKRLRLLNFPPQSTRVYLNTPFMIQADPAKDLDSSQIKPWNSIARFLTSYSGDANAIDSGISISFGATTQEKRLRLMLRALSLSKDMGNAWQIQGLFRSSTQAHRFTGKPDSRF